MLPVVPRFHVMTRCRKGRKSRLSVGLRDSRGLAWLAWAPARSHPVCFLSSRVADRPEAAVLNS